MLDLAEFRELLDEGVTSTPAEELPRLIGELEQAKAAAWAKLTAATARSAEPDDDEILTMPEVAELMRRSEDVVREMGRQGALPTVRIGTRGVGVRRGALREYIRRNESKGFGR